MAVMSILPKSNDQLITDGKAKPGQLTSSGQKELSNDKTMVMKWKLLSFPSKNVSIIFLPLNWMSKKNI